MAKPTADPFDATISYNTVFIDTSLDTHLVTTVSNCDTVSDLKNKILFEHTQCFPEIGNININALKVKRRGCFYRLSESMFVKSAFRGFNKDWFITVDACNVDAHKGVTNGAVNLLSDSQPETLTNGGLLFLEGGERQKGPVGLDLSGLQMFEPTADDHRKVACLNINNELDSAVQGEHNEFSKENKVHRMHIEGQECGSRNEIRDVQDCVASERIADGVKKKGKRKRKCKDNMRDLVSMENDDSVLQYGENESEQVVLIPQRPLCSAGIVGSHDRQTGVEIVDGSRINSLSDASKRPGTNVLSREREVHVQGESGKSKNNVVSVQCDKSLDESSHSEPVAKKRHKIKKKKGEKYLPKENINLSDPNKEKSKAGTVSDKQKNTDATLDGSAETIDGADLHSAYPSTGERTKIKKLANSPNQDVAAVSSTKRDAGEEKAIGSKDLGKKHSTAPCQEINRLALQDAGNVEGRKDVSEPVTASNAKNRANPKDTEDEINVVPTSEYHEVGETVRPEKSSKKRRKSKKTADLAGRDPGTSHAEHGKDSVPVISSTEPHRAIDGDHPSDQGNELKRSFKERKEASETVTVSDFRLATDTEINDVIKNVVESVQQIKTTHWNAENVDGISRKKTRKKQRSDAKKLLELQAEIDDISQKVPASSADNTRMVNASSKLMQEINVENSSFRNQTNVSSLERKKDALVENDAPSITVESSQVPPEKFDGSNKGRCLEAVDNSCPSKEAREDKTRKDTEVMHESDGIDFKEYFVPSQQHCETVSSSELVKRVTKTKGAGGKKSVKKKTKLGVHSRGPSPDLEASPVLDKNHEIGSRPQADNSSATPELQDSFLNAKSDNSMLNTNKRPSEVSGDGVKALPSCVSDELNFNTEAARRSNNVNPASASAYEKSNKEARASVKCSPGKSKNTNVQNKMVNGHQSHEEHSRKDDRKPLTTSIGEVVNSSERGESLLERSGRIFNDDNLGDFIDGDELGESDSSTRTPSDNSFSSDYSDEESNSVSISSQNGSRNWKRKGADGKKTTNLLSSGMTLDTILRSSSRFKKAKLTASQSQLEDTESQPVDFVPDSQANA